MLTVRPATVADARVLFDWRKDPVTRQMTRNTASVEWADHLSWLEASLRNPARKLSVVEINGEPAATGRFDYAEEVEFSVTIAPKWRCKGASLRIVEALLSDAPSFVGYIKEENLTSQRLLSAAGLCKLSDGPFQKWALQAPSSE